MFASLPQGTCSSDEAMLRSALLCLILFFFRLCNCPWNAGSPPSFWWRISSCFHCGLCSCLWNAGSLPSFWWRIVSCFHYGLCGCLWNVGSLPSLFPLWSLQLSLERGLSSKLLGGASHLVSTMVSAVVSGTLALFQACFQYGLCGCLWNAGSIQSCWAPNSRFLR